MNIRQSIRHIHNLDQASLQELLQLRAVFDDAEPTQDIEQDLQDLFIYPERLLTSYSDEWRAFIKRALRKHGLHSAESSLPLIENVLKQRIAQKSEWLAHVLALGQSAIEHAIAVENSPNISSFRHPRVKQLHKLLKL